MTVIHNKDWNDAIRAGHSARETADAAWMKKGPSITPESPGERQDKPSFPPQPLQALTLPELFSMDIRARAMLLNPILPEKGLAMVYGPRGMGKTLLALSIGYAVASGGKALCWSAPEPRRVLYVDGEMPLIVLRERLANIVGSADREPPADYLKLVAADHIEEGIPSLAGATGQALIEPLLGGVSLLVIDNISTLASSGRDNDAESWGPVQEWLLKLRRRGVSVLLVHHAGKAGQQRGTSRREDVLDTVVALRRPSDYQPSEGARFEVHFEKARGAHGDAVAPFEARYEVRDGASYWDMRDLADADLARVVAGLKEGQSVRDIAEETGMSKSKVQRLKTRSEQEGA
jgi:putative DNA primase/helicase